MNDEPRSKRKRPRRVAVSRPVTPRFPLPRGAAPHPPGERVVNGERLYSAAWLDSRAESNVGLLAGLAFCLAFWTLVVAWLV